MKASIKKENPIYFIHNKRFDIGYKLVFLSFLKKSKNISLKIYKDHIRAFSLGTFTEPGNKKKIGINNFTKDFLNIFNSIKNKGFDKKNFLPVNQNRIILNGSHRLASSIYLKKKIFYKIIKHDDPIFDYKFFKNRKVDTDYLDLVAIEYIKHFNKPYLAFVWPNAGKNISKLDTLIPNIIYKKKIKLNFNAAKILLSQVYQNARWIGNSVNNYKGLNDKLMECFGKKKNLTIYAFHHNKIKDVKILKDKIRSIYNVGKSSLHITDTREEAINLSEFCFNNNSINFINFSNSKKVFLLKKKIIKIKKLFTKRKINLNNVVITGSFVLELFGLRKSKDIDYISIDRNKNLKSKKINSHTSQAEYYDKNFEELIYDSKNYFKFLGIKFLSLERLYLMKKKRNEGKDKRDCLIINGFIKRDYDKILFNKILQNIYYLLIKIKYNLVIILKKFKLFFLFRAVYRFFFKERYL